MKKVVVQDLLEMQVGREEKSVFEDNLGNCNTKNFVKQLDTGASTPPPKIQWVQKR